MHAPIPRGLTGALLLACLMACTATPATPATGPTASQPTAVNSASQSAPAAPTPTLGAGPGPMEDDTTGPDTTSTDAAGAARPVPVWDDAARSSALEAATAAIGRWARPEADADTWWRDLAPALSPAAREAYVGTDPTLVPVRNPGPGTLTDTSSLWLATVAFATDAGAWDVLLSRQPEGSWLVERITAASPVHP